MIKYNPKTWFAYIVSIRKSDTLFILWKELVLLFIFVLGLTYIELNYFDDMKQWKDLIAVYSLIGFVLSLLLVFRTNTAYDRWWEGRKKWGELVNNSRNFALKLQAVLKDEEDRTFFSRMIANYAISLKNHLRDLDATAELNLSEQELAGIKQVKHQPNYINRQIYQRLNALKSSGKISDIDYLTIDTNLKTFSDITGACERIKNTPIPYSYSNFLKKFIFIYVITLPLAFVGTFGYYAAPITVFVFYALVSMEILAEEIEDPFGIDDNDLPTDDLSVKIKNNVLEIMD